MGELVPDNQSKAPDDERLTVESFKDSLPPNVAVKVTERLVKSVNKILIGDESIRYQYRNNLISYSSVMQNGKYKLTDYIDAVRYVSFKMLKQTNIQAYSNTFPERYKRQMDRGTSRKDISSLASAYNAGKLVTGIMEQTLIPIHIMNADILQEAINVQAELMSTALSEKVRCDAANSIMTHLKAPVTTKMELDVKVSNTGAMDRLEEITNELAAKQLKIIESGGMAVKEVAESSIVKVINPEDEL